VPFDNPPSSKRHANVTVRGDLIDAAREFGINLSALLERALTVELAEMRRSDWRSGNAGGIAAYNDNLERHGTFSSGGRRF
jgi:antitoxin CcdA